MIIERICPSIGNKAIFNISERSIEILSKLSGNTVSIKLSEELMKDLLFAYAPKRGGHFRYVEFGPTGGYLNLASSVNLPNGVYLKVITTGTGYGIHLTTKDFTMILFWYLKEFDEESSWKN